MNDKQLLSKFKSKGLSLSVEAFKAVKSTMKDVSLDRILEELEVMIAKQEIRSSVIDVGVIGTVVQALTTDVDELELTCLELIDAFQGPRLSFDERLKTYTL